MIRFGIPIFPQIPLIRPHQVVWRPDIDMDTVDDPVADVLPLVDLEPDRVGELVLALVAGAGPGDGVKDARLEDIGPEGAEVAWGGRRPGLLDHVDDPVAVGEDDPVAGDVLHMGDADGGLGVVGGVVLDEVGKEGLRGEEVVAEDDSEGAVDDVLAGGNGVREAEPLVLDHVGEVDAEALPRAQVVGEAVLVRGDDDDDVGDPGEVHRLDDVLDHRFFAHGEELFRDRVRKRPKPRPRTCGGDQPLPDAHRPPPEREGVRQAGRGVIINTQYQS
mgnify:CR=1 FL=1